MDATPNMLADTETTMTTPATPLPDAMATEPFATRCSNVSRFAWRSYARDNQCAEEKGPITHAMTQPDQRCTING